MRYLVIYRPEAGVEGAPPSPEHMAAMGELVETMMRAGSLLSTEPLAERSQGARVRLAQGEFTESEETVRAGGYALLNAGSREEAVALAKQFLTVAGDGTCEIRQIFDFIPPAA
jgi:hypothetical protein